MAFRPRQKSRQGCTLCKRRRKKCDEVKPICGTCTRLALPCSWTPLQPATTENMLNRRSHANFEAFITCLTQRSAIPHTIDLSAYQGQICAAYTLETMFQGANLPFDLINSDANGRSIHATLTLGTSNESLAWDCFVCLGLAFAGRRNGNHNLIQTAKVQYIRALNKIRSVVSDVNQRFRLDTLAAINLLIILSLLMPWLSPADSHTSAEFGDVRAHGLGLLALIETIGPHAFQNPPALAFFEHVRRGLLGLAFLDQRETSLTSEAWKTVPWTHSLHAKDSNHRLLDILCEVVSFQAAIRPDTSNQQIHHGSEVEARQKEVSDILLKLRDWRQSIEPDLSARFRVSNRAARLPRNSTHALRIWQFRRASDLSDLAVFNMMLIYLCGCISASTTLAEPASTLSSSMPETSLALQSLATQLTLLELPIRDPDERAKVAAREAFFIWDCATRDGLFAVALLYLSGPLNFAERFLARSGATLPVTLQELFDRILTAWAGTS